MLYHELVLHLFSRLNHILLCGYGTCCLSIYQLMDTELFLLFIMSNILFCNDTIMIMLPWTFMSKYLLEQLFSIILSIYLEVELLECMLTLHLIIWRNARLFSKVAALFYISTNSIWGLQLCHILTNTCYYLPFWL